MRREASDPDELLSVSAAVLATNIFYQRTSQRKWPTTDPVNRPRAFNRRRAVSHSAPALRRSQWRRKEESGPRSNTTSRRASSGRCAPCSACLPAIPTPGRACRPATSQDLLACRCAPHMKRTWHAQPHAHAHAHGHAYEALRRGAEHGGGWVSSLLPNFAFLRPTHCLLHSSTTP